MGSRLAALLLCGLLCARPVSASPALGDGDEDVVAGVELHLPSGVDASGLAQLVAVRRGQVLLGRNVRRTLERLYATGRFSSAVARVHARARAATRAASAPSVWRARNSRSFT